MILSDLIKNLDIEDTSADMNTMVTGVTANSSEVKPGYVFTAIQGVKSDGHDYIEQAVKNGAACIICQKEIDADTQHVKVADTRKAMSVISANWFGNPARKLKLVGITGTNGKTTITYLLKHIIEHTEKCKVGLIGTIENLIGDKAIESSLTTPDSYQLQYMLSEMVKAGCTYAVMEVSSHALSQSRVYGLEFETGIFTNLTNDHLDYHLNMDDYGKAKAELFKVSRNSIINSDDKYAGLMAQSSTGNILTYALEDQKADLTGKSIKLNPRKTEFEVYYQKTGYPVSVNIPGVFTVYNTLAAIATGTVLGYNISETADAIETFNGVKGRAEVLPISEDYTVIIDYAHTPDALENIIKTARSITKGRVHTLFGCGGDRDKTKRPLMGKIAIELSDYVTVTSDNPRTEDPDAIIKDILQGIEEATKKQGCSKEGLKVITDRRSAIREALDILLAGDILLLAGKGHETYQIIGNKKIHFDDREVVLEHLMRTTESKRRLHHSH